MSRYLITGASGLLGGEVIRQGEDDAEFLSLGRTGPDAPVAHVDDEMTTTELPGLAGVDGVFHLVQSDAFRSLPTGLSNLVAVNVLSTARLLEWAISRGVPRFILASSGAVYSNTAKRELVDLPSLNTYAASRRAAELIAVSQATQIEVVVLRYFFIYGKNQDRRMVLPRLADSIADGRPVRLDGRDGMLFNPVHVRDAARQTLAAMRAPAPGVYDVCGPTVITLREVAGILGGHVGRDPVFESSSQAAVEIVGRPETDALGPVEVSPDCGLRDVCRVPG